jgi:hypothetical protein
MKTLCLTVEPAALARLAELTTCLSLLEQVGPRSVEVSQVLGRLRQGPAALDLRFLVTGVAGDQWISLEASELENDLVAAMGTFDWNGG